MAETSLTEQHNMLIQQTCLSWLGILAIVLGVYLTAAHGNEWMKYWVLSGPASIDIEGHQAKCPEDELEEEGISIAACQQATANVDTLLLSRPDWYRSLQIGLMGIGTLLAFVSIFIGVALIENRTWATNAAIATFAGLLFVDAVGFLAAINTGPLLRQMYLWQILFWLIVHMLMLAAAMACRDTRYDLIDKAQSNEG